MLSHLKKCVVFNATFEIRLCRYNQSFLWRKEKKEKQNITIERTFHLSLFTKNM